MIEKFEKISIDSKTNESLIEIVAKEEATHIHKCRHDEKPPKGCSREKIK